MNKYTEPVNTLNGITNQLSSMLTELVKFEAYVETCFATQSSISHTSQALNHIRGLHAKYTDLQERENERITTDKPAKDLWYIEFHREISHGYTTQEFASLDATYFPKHLQSEVKVRKGEFYYTCKCPFPVVVNYFDYKESQK